MYIGPAVAHWGFILSQQGALGMAMDEGLLVTAATADDFLEAHRQLMAGLQETVIPQERLRRLVQDAIHFKEVVAGRGQRHGVRVTEVLRALDKRLKEVDPSVYSAGVRNAKRHHGFGLARPAPRLSLHHSADAAREVVREAIAPAFNPSFYLRIKELDLSVRARNALANVDIYYVWELVQKTEAELLKIKNFWRKSFKEVKEVLVELGLHLGMKVEGFSRPAAEQFRASHPELFAKR